MAPARRKPALPKPTLLLLVRHGTTATTGKVLPGRTPGLHLSEGGRKQAEEVGARLAAWSGVDHQDGSKGGKRPRISAVYTSPLERTRETAAALAAPLGLRAVVERALLECDFGEWTGGELKELVRQPEWATVQRHPSGFRFPGGESFPEMQARVLDCMERICSRHRGEVVVAVSHADPIKAAVADALGTPLDLFQRIVISPCSVSAVSYGPLGPTVLTVNAASPPGEPVPA